MVCTHQDFVCEHYKLTGFYKCSVYKQPSNCQGPNWILFIACHFLLCLRLMVIMHLTLSISPNIFPLQTVVLCDPFILPV